MANNDDVLPLKAARRDAVANLNILSVAPARHQRLNFGGFIYIRYETLPFPVAPGVYVWVNTPVLFLGIWHKPSFIELKVY